MKTRRSRAAPPRVLMLAPEAAPLRGDGARAAAIGALAERLHAAGVDLTLGLPRVAAPRDARRDALTLPLGGGPVAIEVERFTTDGGLPVWSLAVTGLDGEAAGDSSGEASVAWGIFCAAALRLAARAEHGFDVVHLHHWETAAAAVLLGLGGPPAAGLEGMRSVLTVHDPRRPGSAPRALLGRLGLPEGLFHPQLLEQHGEVSLLKGGLVFADLLTLPSAQAARAARRGDPAGEGGELGALLRERAADTIGILQGIPDEWDPARDPRLAADFSAQDPGGRAACKAALQAELGLPERQRVPLLAFVEAAGAGEPDAGLGLLLDALPGLRRRELQVAIVTAGDGELRQRAVALAAARPDRVAVAPASPGLVRRALAGCDLILLAGRSDAHGALVQRALRYGAVPLAPAAAAAAAECVRPASARALAAGRAGGFLFAPEEPAALQRALGRALVAYRDGAGWRRLVAAALGFADPWPTCVRRHRALYRELAARPQRRVELPLLPAPPALVPRRPEPPAPGAAAVVEPTAAPYIDWGPELPELYGEDALELLVQAPRSLYAYWEIAPWTRAAAGDGGLRLLLEEDEVTRELTGSLDDAGEWWVAARPLGRYRLAIATAGGRILLRSSEVTTPAEAAREAAPGGAVRWVHRARRPQADGTAAGSEPLYHYRPQGPVGRFGPSAWQAAAAARERPAGGRPVEYPGSSGKPRREDPA